MQTKVDYTKLSLEIITLNYRLVYYVAQKWVNYRDTGVSKKKFLSKKLFLVTVKVRVVVEFKEICFKYYFHIKFNMALGFNKIL